VSARFVASHVARLSIFLSSFFGGRRGSLLELDKCSACVAATVGVAESNGTAVV
jgi:hypothetical protein